MSWIDSYAPLYAVVSLLAAVAAFVAGRRSRVDAGSVRTAVFATLSGLVWPILLLGLLQLAMIHAAGWLVRYVDRPARQSVRPQQVPFGGAMLTAR